MAFFKTFATLLASFALVNTANAFNGDATWYHTGLGSCGSFSQESDFIVALSVPEAAGGAHCWQHINVFYQGQVIDVTVVDTCEGCNQFDIDLSPGAFQALAPLDAGRIQVDWEWA